MWTWRKLALGATAVVGVIGLVVVALAAWQVATAESSMQFPDTPYPEVTASTDPDVIARGRYLAYGPAQCVHCHGDYEREHPEAMKADPPPALAGGMAFEMGPIGTLWAPNLTNDPETGLGRYTDGEIARTLRTGVRPNGTFSMFMGMGPARLSLEDELAVISFLRSTAPVHRAVPDNQWGLLGKLILPLIPMAPRTMPPPTGVPPGDTPSLARGEYLVLLAGCAQCHSPIDPMTGEILGTPLSGSNPEPSHGPDSDKEYVAPNLTSDPTGVTGRLDEDAFVARIRAGRTYASSIMPWEPFGTMTDADLRSIYQYLRSVPPVSNDVGPTYRDIGWTP